MLKADIAEKHQAINTANFSVSSLKMMETKVQQHFHGLTNNVALMLPIEEGLRNQIIQADLMALKLDEEIQALLAESNIIEEKSNQGRVFLLQY